MEQLDLKTLSLAVMQIAEERGILEEKVVGVIETALSAAYRKELGKKEEKYRARFNKETGRAEFFLVKKILDESMIMKEEEVQKEEAPQTFPKKEGEFKKVKFNPARHIMINEISNIKYKISNINDKPYTSSTEIKPGDEIEFPLQKPEKFGRIAAQTAKQVLLQKIKEVEKETVLQEFLQKRGEILSGIIQRKTGETIFIDLGKTTGVLPREEQIPGEFYRPVTRMRFLCLDMKESPKGPEIYLSRSHPKFLSKLFELEVPEISSGTVEIKAVAREAGNRSKIAVFSKEKGIDPVGSCVGAKGTRVNAVIQELGREKIDIISFSPKIEEFIENAMSPAKVVKVILEKNRAKVEVPRNELPLAIGKNGQNVKLASELTGWKIDVVANEEETKQPTTNN